MQKMIDLLKYKFYKFEAKQIENIHINLCTVYI